MHAQNGRVLIRSNDKARCDHNPIIKCIRIDMFDTINAFDDIFQRPRNELDRVCCFIAVGRNDDIDHGYTDLRLFFTRQCRQRNNTNQKRRDQKEGRQR